MDMSDPLRELLDLGDEALHAGELVEASTWYRRAVESIELQSTPEDAPLYILTATISHRLGVLDVASGDQLAAETDFARVSIAANQAAEFGEDPELVMFVENIVARSQVVRADLTAISDRESIHLDQIIRAGICKHGCFWSSADCDMPGPHC
jgi:hypothetical protein